ncbi:MAG: hypothetical protein V4574_09840 [Pseudomonadota bacterium]
MRIVALLACLWLALAPAAAAPQDYLYLGQDELELNLPILDRPDISGAQVMYVWGNLEPEKGKYDFSMIEHDLALATARGKGFFIEVLDRLFQPQASRNFPRYLREDPEYGGGIAWQGEGATNGRPGWSGWVARQWDPEVRARFQALHAALAKLFDGRVTGIILTETAASVNKETPPEGWTCDGYFEAEKENALFVRNAFPKSHVVLYANFWPCGWANENTYMSRFFDFAAANRIGVGGPDLIPWNWGQMRNSYPFIYTNRDKVPLVAIAVQEPTLEFTSPATGKPFTRAEFTDYAVYLGVDIIFWSKDTPWLRR